MRERRCFGGRLEAGGGVLSPAEDGQPQCYQETVSQRASGSLPQRPGWRHLEVLTLSVLKATDVNGWGPSARES